MTTTQQLFEFSRFTQQLVAEEGESLSLAAIFDRWHQQAYQDEDLTRIRASVNDFENGERGRPLENFLCEFENQ